MVRRDSPKQVFTCWFLPSPPIRFPKLRLTGQVHAPEVLRRVDGLVREMNSHD